MSYFEGSVFTVCNELTGPINKFTFIKLLKRVSSKVVNKKQTPQQITKILKGALKSFDIDIFFKRDSAVSQNTFLANAYYGGDVDSVEIELELGFHPRDKHITLSPAQWAYSVELVADVLVHEYIHSSQASKRDYLAQRSVVTKEIKSARKFQDVKRRKGPGYTMDRYFEDIEYYGNPDEMEAFAYNAANELLLGQKDHLAVLKLLNNYSRIKLKDSPVFDEYNIIFMPNSFVMKKFVKMVTKYLKQIPEYRA